MENYLEINKNSWNNPLESHLNSDFYDMPAFLNGKSSLHDIELDLLGDINGKKILHLQCHFGQDTISLARMGAQTVGIDLSDESIKTAKELALKTKSSARFVCSNVYDLPDNLDEQFDIVFASYGTIPWLPDLNKWGHVIQHFLKPGGQFIFVEFHPVVWMFDDDLKKVAFHYNNVEPIIEEETGTYADKNANIKSKYVCWNHGIGEVTNSLIKNNLQLKELNEFCYSPYSFLPGSQEFEPGKFRIEQFGNKFPLVYSLLAVKDK